jgi:hypothetical protein
LDKFWINYILTMADFPSPSSAYGRWNLMDVRDAVMGGNWPGIATAPSTVEYLVVAGGGGGGTNHGGGAGAGGFRTATGFSVTAGTPITVTVGAGGTASGTSPYGQNGNNSVFSSITSAGGGAGANNVSTATIFAMDTPGAGSVTYQARASVSAGTSTVYGTATRASIAARLLVLDMGNA